MVENRINQCFPNPSHIRITEKTREMIFLNMIVLHHFMILSRFLTRRSGCSGASPPCPAL